MTETTSTAAEDRTLPAIVYALYLVGLTHGLTTVIGLIIAYAQRDSAGPAMRSHYTWLIRTFWLTIVVFAVGAVIFAVGVPLSLILIGVPLVMVGGLMMGAAWVYCAVRCIIGVIHLARGEPIARPEAWLA